MNEYVGFEVKTSCFDTYLGQGTRLESSRKKPKRSMKKWTKRKLKSTKYGFTPSSREEAPDGMEVTPDGRRAVPSGMNYLEDISKKSRIEEAPSGRVLPQKA